MRNATFETTLSLYNGAVQNCANSVQLSIYNLYFTWKIYHLLCIHTSPGVVSFDEAECLEHPTALTGLAYTI
jgi:hypothetical protein